MSLAKALLSSSALRLEESCRSSGLLERALQNLEGLASRITLEPEEVLLLQGEEGDKFYVVQDGTVEAVDQTTGQVMHVFQKGERFGERWLLYQHEPAGATCRAGKEGATLKCVSRACFQAEFSSCFVTAGSIRGRIVRAKTTKATRFLERDVSEFRGVEFATRGSRFALPVVKDYHGHYTVDAFEFGPECLQISGTGFDIMNPSAPKRSRPSLLQFLHNKKETPPNENCLCLNVWAPIGSNDQMNPPKFPVMVWIHGGGFLTGSGSLSMYDGRELSSKGVVVITINYRLGALGFLAGIPGVPLNLGLHDQIEALRWVKKHAHLFGGDSGNITVFGESAGGMSISCLMGTRVRRQEQLFQKAIVQSGNARAVLSQRQATSTQALFEKALLSVLKLPKDTKVDRTLLDSVPVDAIIKASENLTKSLMRGDVENLRGFIMPFQPVCFENGPISADLLFEGVNPSAQIARGIADDVTLLTGINNTEYSLFMMDNAWRKMLAKTKNSRNAYKNSLKQTIISWASPLDGRYRPVVNLEARAQAIVDFYLPNGSSDELTEDDAFRAFERIHSSWLFDIGGDLLASMKAADGGSRPVYLYRLHFLCPMDQLGSPHAVDLPLVFGTFKSDPIAGMLSGDGPEAVLASNEMMKAWIAFAKNGNPGWAPRIPKIFGADRSATFPGLTNSLYLTTAERELWRGFVEPIELDSKIWLGRASRL